MSIVKISDTEVEETKEIKTRFKKPDLIKAEKELTLSIIQLSTRLTEIRDMISLLD